MSELAIYILTQLLLWLGFVVALIIVGAFGVFVFLYIIGTVLQALGNRKKP